MKIAGKQFVCMFFLKPTNSLHDKEKEERGGNNPSPFLLTKEL